MVLETYIRWGLMMGHDAMETYIRWRLMMGHDTMKTHTRWGLMVEYDYGNLHPMGVNDGIRSQPGNPVSHTQCELEHGITHDWPPSRLNVAESHFTAPK